MVLVGRLDDRCERSVRSFCFVPRGASEIKTEQRELSGGTAANIAIFTSPVSRWCPGFSRLTPKKTHRLKARHQLAIAMGRCPRLEILFGDSWRSSQPQHLAILFAVICHSLISKKKPKHPGGWMGQSPTLATPHTVCGMGMKGSSLQTAPGKNCRTQLPTKSLGLRLLSGQADLLETASQSVAPLGLWSS